MFNSKREEKGQGLVEYALVLVLVAVVVIGVLTVLGPSVSQVYAQVIAGLGGGGSGDPYGHWPNSAYDYCESGANSTALQLFFDSGTGLWIAGHPSMSAPSGYVAHSMMPSYPRTCGAFLAEGHNDTR